MLFVSAILFFGYKYINYLSSFENKVLQRLELIESRNKIVNTNLNKLSNDYNNIEQRYSSIFKMMSSSEKDFIINDIDNLLNIANQCLLVTRDVNRSIILLERALFCLNSFSSDARSVLLRDSICKNIENLQNIKVIDNHRYLDYIDRLYEFCHGYETAHADIKSSSLSYGNISNIEINDVDTNIAYNQVKNFYNIFIQNLCKFHRYVFQGFSKLITIDKVNDGLLSDNHFLIYMLQQQLCTARFALVTFQPDLWDSSVKFIQDIFNNYFDKEDYSVRDYIKLSSLLNGAVFDKNMFDISDSLSYMKDFRSVISEENIN
ncbi:uroporphyrin-III C-methyltransferase [Candidatus Kinetoplastibacterium desouzaii TCC079E]|uniref:Uroporphyrin-III C-methyltransferase n=2 Tax=Candidatus Kinetoplastidibacterium desouzai TaxID=994692 RepID=M1L1Z2_9PROT|nr:uroporphyrin-III C-methyltransferase [Candidatus Kinetoplastibacterium desouzaii TCC079E]